ncbi:ferritin-like domain-containing protein [Tistrella mobilis]|uniref:Ferritin-like domain-containing protein n=1 Tax=Tistrella mobilis (strain KA081020-065) TaxID=1110502 RepID=I3TVP5_TISMK|nr:ferritin-like domain-containing protein [Tistrella mobilis]AFK56833.1 hypothetical protein TMO_c0223 [Tistrella mobilis KA081020-065]MAM72482.1 DUF3066 domain-containing protein [Tistrella sp.]
MPETTSVSRSGAFRAVGPAGFLDQIRVPRYAERTDLFDEIIAETHRHFWDPLDTAYIRFDEPFDMATETVMPASIVPELNSAVADRLTAEQRVWFANESARWWLSSVLHGEQGALSLSASLCHMLADPGVVEYAANQAREEARHVTAFSRYIHTRWGAPMPASDVLGGLLKELVDLTDVPRKIVGMQLLVEGLAMGIFASLHSKSQDPVLRRLTQLVMTDEAFHHRAGKLWGRDALPMMDEKARNGVEDWAAQCFQILMFNMLHPSQKQALYAPLGLDWEWVRDAMKESYTSDVRRAEMSESTNVFRVLVKTLLHAGIITDRTRPLYAQWVDLGALAGEGEGTVGDAIAAEGLEFLAGVNAARRSRHDTAA